VNDTTPALIYARQSLGNAASITEQLDLGRARADTEGWTIHAEYQDRISASRYAHKARTDWPKLVADVQHDRAGIIWLWESSRGERRASTWLALLEDCRDHGTRIYVETHGRLYDMANPRDWRNLAEDGTDSEYESHKTSQRVARSAAARAAAGKVNGRAPYGYRRRYELTDAGKRVLVGQERHPDEAPIVEEVIGRVAGGDSLRAIAASLNGRGVPTKTGAKWSTTQVRGVALNLAYIGKRVHAPGSRRSRSVPGPEAAVYDATWPPLVDEPTFYAARRILLDPARKTTRPGKAKHLLSLIATCAVCGGKLTVTYRLRQGKRPAYACRDRNCVAIDHTDLDSYVTAEVLAVLARPRTWKRLVAAGAQGNAELDTARAVLAERQAYYDETVRLFKARKISPAAFAEAEPGFLADLEAARKHVSELESPAPLRFMIDGPADLAARWEAAPVSARRQAIQALVRVTVGKSTSAGHRVPAAKRVTIGWL
jgi:DNA invertase Pin-like site-specific DNA recombinase